MMMVTPTMMYGTAWKEAETERLTRMAIEVGFRAIDTANQRKHYFEAGVGEALKQAYSAGRVRRAELFLQTKFTYARGQDHRLPYDPAAPLANQVRSSLASSLEHLATDYLDSYVLHGPYLGSGIGEADWEVWRTMESFVEAKQVHRIGISNVHLEQLQALWKGAKVKPAFVQNRCFARDQWDRATREFCTAQGIVYQGFSLLTANPEVLNRARFQDLVRRTGKTPSQVIFRFAQQIGMLPLTGTKSEAHMREDLAIGGFELTPAEVSAIERG
jgi:diketogulonate reductase-like aldo/keto reductase